MTDQLTVGYEGTEPFPDGSTPPRTFEGGVRVAVTAAIVLVPFGGLGLAVWLAWGHAARALRVELAIAGPSPLNRAVTAGSTRLSHTEGQRPCPVPPNPGWRSA